MRYGTLALALALAGCAAPPPSPGRQAQLDEIARSTPTCADAADCAAKWDAAQLYVVRNARMKIQTATNVLIETFNSPPYKTELAMRVTKEPIGGGRYRFVAKAWCSNLFSCYPDPTETVLAFNREVSAARP